uniref:Uncharacterized protein n=1 Tax=Chromera velia CCMP2878 TaxID=1169474 RepID=A0A0G4H3H7_9ALVE|eukprot:Cvel_24526.t1-p1 / transcript=Cvel_24526.t1 / gene=Cvel_24526 / organism=Chromera_velia_CCMP2878 / gene_product=hypothetical protein / transcript_product=hypothetical protein / location=Cvel_scaffold2661:18218-19636(-) / protein_length=385 / sequence_SO=supercontig / SO=protein_coding / is_pseudo=false
MPHPPLPLGPEEAEPPCAPVAPPPPVLLKAPPPVKAPALPPPPPPKAPAPPESQQAPAKAPAPPPPPPKAPAPPESQQAPPKAPAPPESQQAPPKAPTLFERQQAPSKAPAPPPPPPPPKAAALLSPLKAPALFGSQQAPAKAPSPPIAPPSPPAQGKRRASAVPAPAPAKKPKGPKKTHRCVDRLKAVKQAIEKEIESTQLGKALEWQLVMEEGGDRAIGCLLKTSTGKEVGEGRKEEIEKAVEELASVLKGKKKFSVSYLKEKGWLEGKLYSTRLYSREGRWSDLQIIWSGLEDPDFAVFLPLFLMQLCIHSAVCGDECSASYQKADHYKCECAAEGGEEKGEAPETKRWKGSSNGLIEEIASCRGEGGEGGGPNDEEIKGVK